MTDPNSRNISRSCSSLAIAFMYSVFRMLAHGTWQRNQHQNYGSPSFAAEITQQMCYHRSLPGSFFKMPELRASLWKTLLVTATCLAVLSLGSTAHSQE